MYKKRGGADVSIEIPVLQKDFLDTLNLQTDSCIYTFLHTIRAYSVFARESVKRNCDVNFQRLGMLILLRAEGNGMSQTQLAEELCVKPSSVASMLNNMEKEELIIRKSDGEDKRVKRIYFTETGKKISDDAFKYMIGIAHDFFFDFTDEEKKRFMFLMKKMENNIKQTPIGQK